MPYLIQHSTSLRRNSIFAKKKFVKLYIKIIIIVKNYNTITTMETLELEKRINKIKVQETDLYDEDGYLIASLEEGLADERAGRLISFKSREDRMRYLLQEFDDV